MDRPAKAEETYKKWFKSEIPKTGPDHEIMSTIFNFTLADIPNQGDVPEKLHHIILLACLTANQLLPQLKQHVTAALNIGLTQDEIKETLYQCTPYIGAPRVVNAIKVANEAIKESGAELKEIKNSNVDEKNRYEKGLEVRKKIFGDAHTEEVIKKATEENKHIQNYLCEYCFGDFYTRGVLELKTREIITFVANVSLGGCDPQVKAHANGNKAVGNEKKLLIDVVSHLIHINGFPKSLNAIAAINEAYN